MRRIIREELSFSRRLNRQALLRHFLLNLQPNWNHLLHAAVTIQASLVAVAAAKLMATLGHLLDIPIEARLTKSRLLKLW